MDPKAMITGLQWLNGTRERNTASHGSAVLFAHIGRLEHQALRKLVEVTEHASLANGDPSTVRKRLVNVVIEGLENLHHHPDPAHRTSTIALLTSDEAGYKLAIGNTMHAAVATHLEHRIGIMNAMDDADLRAHYLGALALSDRTEKGGAGLGLLTMARKSARPIATHTASVDGEVVFFGMEFWIPVN